ncbi:MAG: hypothetical protein ACK4K7_15485 [Allosphingosinicella sp.]|uniref:hypothetical protein n=1 Tax=Allosphingosinicella sp. TaxID=2823234 RepID=UPI0039311705
MKKLVLLTAVVALGGCATANTSFTQQPPRLAFKSANAVDDIRTCIGQRMARWGTPGVSQVDGVTYIALVEPRFTTIATNPPQTGAQQTASVAIKDANGARYVGVNGVFEENTLREMVRSCV